jgi:UDP-N-acetylmuramyl pentapeptide phosphotransferase/UDP-N-acetylglucosamine-1-phosphate transferase
MSALVDSYSAGLLVVIGGLAAVAVTQLLGRMLAFSDFLLDRPNERSSHLAATPRSGGIAIFGGWIVGVGLIALFADWTVFGRYALLLAPLVGAAFLFGLADDRLNLNAPLKFFAQTALALFYVALFGPLQSAPLPFIGETSLGPWAGPLTVFWIVGFMNAYNFMDGVNGIASACGGLALACLAAASAFAGAPFWAVTTGIAAAALMSFLPLNLPKARLFMGDNGSQAVGFLFAAASVGAANQSDGAIGAYFGPILMMPFLFDVAFTLVHRARRGRNILSAHREHLYQLLTRLGLSHVAATAVFLSFAAFSAAVAILSLRAAPGLQFLAPLLLSALFLFPALKLFRRAELAGFFAAPPETETPAREEPAPSAAHAQAAE